MDSTQGRPSMFFASALAIGGILVGAAASFYIYRSRKVDCRQSIARVDTQGVLQDVRLLGEVRREILENDKGVADDERTVLSQNYFCSLSAIVTFHQRLLFKEEKAELVAKRQALFQEIAAEESSIRKDGLQADYEELVMWIHFMHETIFNQLFEDVLQDLGISKEEFKRSQVHYSNSDVAIKSIKQALQHGKPDPVTLSENLDLAQSLLLSVLESSPIRRVDTVTALKFRQMALMESRKSRVQARESDTQFDEFVEELIAQAQAADKTFVELGQSEVEMDDAVFYFHFKENDEEIAQIASECKTGVCQ